MNDQFDRPTMGSALHYRDPVAALDWLEQAFDFRRTMVITDQEGTLMHAEMRFRGGYVMIGGEWASFTASPASVEGKNTQTVHVHLGGEADGPIAGHHDRALAAGADIVRPVAQQFYGDITYSARDPEGHVWTFSQTVTQVSREEAEAASGLKITGWT